jgi:predicted DNA-binding transcriptional regulator AlpA
MNSPKKLPIGSENINWPELTIKNTIKSQTSNGGKEKGSEEFELMRS